MSLDLPQDYHKIRKHKKDKGFGGGQTFLTSQASSETGAATKVDRLVFTFRTSNNIYSFNYQTVYSS